MKKILFLLILLISVITVVIINSNNSKIAEQDVKESILLNDLYKQCSHLEHRIKHNEGKIITTLPNKAGVFFVFDQLTDNITKTAKSMLDKRGYTGIAVITDKRLPGKNGNISENDFIQLVENGWEIAIGFESDFVFSSNEEDAKQELFEYISSIKSLDVIKDNNIDISTVVFTSIYSQYKSYFDTTLNEAGINTLISNNSFEYNSSGYFTNKNDLLKIISIEFNMTNTIQTILTDKISNLQPVAIVSKTITDSSSQDSLDISKIKYKTMLDFVNQYDEKTLYTQSLQEYYLNKHSEFTKNNDRISNLLDEIEKDQKKLDELRDQIKDLLNSKSSHN